MTRKRTKNTESKNTTAASPKAIVEGQRIICGLHWAGPGIVYAIHGKQNPTDCKSLAGGIVAIGGQAHFDIVYDNGHRSKHVPESIVRGIQWEILDEVATPAEIKQALEAAMQREREANEQTRRDAEAKEKERAELPAKYPTLRTVEQEPKMSRHALGAKNLRKLLKQAFSEIKFSVTSQSYSGGCSIRVAWEDGPCEKAVDLLADKFQECDFDGMEDLEKFRHTVWPSVFGGAHYVTCARSMSPGYLTEVAKDLSYEVSVGKHEAIEGVDVPTQQMIYREARQRSAGDAESIPEPEPAADGDVTFTEYKGHPVIQIPLNGKGKTFGFGLNKAKAIVAHFAAIERFATRG